MHVKFVSVTQPEVEGINSAEELLVYIARVSNPGNQLNTETADKLLAYLIRNKHWSPFDMVNLCVEVKTSKAVSIQILRHWSIKPQEFSQRYAEVTEIESVELRKAPLKDRQSSIEEEIRFDPVVHIGIDLKSGPVYQDIRASELVQRHMDACQTVYKILLEAGVAKECARFVLPMATSTTLYLNGSVRSWIHYLEQRLDHHAQKEHREVATEIRHIFKQFFPFTFKSVFDGDEV